MRAARSGVLRTSQGVRPGWLGLKFPGFTLHSKRGGAALEFAVLAPVLIILFAGMIEVGRVVDTAMIARNGAREGARYAAVADPNAAGDAAAYVQQSLEGRSNVTFDPSKVTVAYNPSLQVGASVTVQLPVTVNITVPVMQNILSKQVVVWGNATMEVSQTTP